MRDEKKLAESYKAMAIRLFKARGEDAHDWHWRRSRRAQIRGYIWEARRAAERMKADLERVHVLYHIENHRDRITTIVGVFDNKPPHGSGKINKAIDDVIALREKMGIACSRGEFHIVEMVLNKPEVVF